MERMKKIYGMRVVPQYDKSSLLYGGFNGIVITCSVDKHDILISKMLKTEDGGYVVDSSQTMPYEETREHSQTSGKALAEFLYLKAREFFGANHEVAICHELAGQLLLLDEAWEHFKEVSDRKRE